MERFNNPDREYDFYPEDPKPLFRGVWAEKLYSGQELPVGGSVFSETLDTRLLLDFENFDDELGGFTEENINDFFENNRGKYEEYLASFDTDFDPYLHFACFQVQQKVAKLLQINEIKKTNIIERMRMYNERTPKLSEMIGKTMCTERAILAQYILQKIGIESVYVGGVSTFSADGEGMEDHSFLIIKGKATPEQSFVFDVARPHDDSGVPSIYKTAENFDYDLLKDKESNFLVEANEILTDQKVYFGVGDPNLF
ncbi:MAG TPA: hypothetical protein PKA60_02960 [Candidatus Paceibacterota bacterium]|nr:hypothetical protein [Candidatus Paceibacterota bacterium]